MRIELAIVLFLVACLSAATTEEDRIPDPESRQSLPAELEPFFQPLSTLAYVAADCWHALAGLPEVDEDRIGIVGHSYGGKWAMDRTESRNFSQ